MQKVVFLDRDGTLIDEPTDNFQVDSFEKLALKPFVIPALSKLQMAGFQLVMVTNQDGMGTAQFPASNFWPPHNLLMQIFESQGIRFADVFIDCSYENEKSPNRKPNIGMLKKYTEGNYDLRNSWVIGDRITDVEMAKRLQSSAVCFSDGPLSDIETEYFRGGTLKIKSTDWLRIASYIVENQSIKIERKTSETSVEAELLPGLPQIRKISTGIGFLDHMLDQFFFHSKIGCQIECRGDLDVDQHHTIEDVAIVVGEALYRLWKSETCNRYGFTLPMDDALANVTIDLSGRPWLSWDVNFSTDTLGDFPTQMFKHFFYSLVINGKFALHITAKGENDHHIIEAVFKSFGRAFRQAISPDYWHQTSISTKGLL